MQDVSGAGGETIGGNGILQGSAEWRALRLGKVTASRIADVVARTKTGVSASRATYRAELVAERLSGVPSDSFVSPAMAHGTDTEPKARAMYEFMRDACVTETAFVDHPAIPMSGCSPDGLVGSDGLVEIKCPNSKKHIATLLGAPIDPDYAKQMQWQMACTGRKWCDYVSFDPRLPPDMQIHIQRVTRDPIQIAEFEHAVRMFLAEVESDIAALVAKFRKQEAAE